MRRVRHTCIASITILFGLALFCHAMYAQSSSNSAMNQKSNIVLVVQ
jgi:hypothetical protein